MSKCFNLIPLAAAFIAANAFAKVETITIEDLPVLKQESQHSTASKRVTNFFTRAHYKLIDLNDELSTKIFDRYLESLDFGKRIFLKSDIDSFEQYRYLVDNALSTGKLDFAFDISLF